MSLNINTSFSAAPLALAATRMKPVANAAPPLAPPPSPAPVTAAAPSADSVIDTVIKVVAGTAGTAATVLLFAAFLGATIPPALPAVLLILTAIGFLYIIIKGIIGIFSPKAELATGKEKPRDIDAFVPSQNSASWRA